MQSIPIFMTTRSPRLSSTQTRADSTLSISPGCCIRITRAHADAPDSVAGAGFDDYIVSRALQKRVQLFILRKLGGIAAHHDVTAVLFPDERAHFSFLASLHRNTTIFLDLVNAGMARIACRLRDKHLIGLGFCPAYGLFCTPLVWRLFLVVAADCAHRGQAHEAAELGAFQVARRGAHGGMAQPVAHGGHFFD